MTVIRCVLCSIGILGYGHNAQPLAPGRCCDNCNFRRVIPFRRELAMSRRGGEE